MREIFLSELVKDVLGPRNGVKEILEGNPKSEYITGVLSPRNAAPERDPDVEAEITGAPEDAIGFACYEEDVDDKDVLFSSLLQSTLDPRALPHSIGISFLVQSKDGSPSIKLCVTWARYLPQNQEQNKWRRFPRFWISSPIILRNGRQYIYINGSGKQVSRADNAEISIHIISRTTNDRVWHVNVYLVNEITGDSERAKVEEHIFQPQIRIKCLKGSKILPQPREIREDSGVRDPEDLELDFLYRNSPIMAKGYMCSAIWKEIDPERPHHDSTIESIRPKSPPFYWVDGEFVESVVGRAIREEFTCPDVRTEFVPIYPVEAPLLEWDERWGNQPELRAEVLAETWEPSEISKRLMPLIHGYERWINNLKNEIFDLSPEERRIAERILNRCNDVIDRMKKGINLLIQDQDVRLAFCFANKVMDIQARWTRRKGLKWYPYQLAFILTVLESIVNPSSSERDVCDLLWVPTGAGKTEAYLAVAAFTMAYRRRRALRRRSGDRTGGGVSVISRYTLRLLTIQQFRRTLKMITACEYLRIAGLASGEPVGWRPQNCPIRDDFIWGSARFSIGLWVGGNVTPNRLNDTYNPATNCLIPGALSILKGERGDGEPAQIIECPVCGAILAIPEGGLEAGRDHTIHLIIRSTFSTSRIQQTLVNYSPPSSFSITLLNVSVHQIISSYHTLSLRLRSSRPLRSDDVDGLWSDIRRYLKNKGITAELVSARASRPGYFILYYTTSRGGLRGRDFEIYCPNPECELNKNVLWIEGVPKDCGWLDVARGIFRNYRSQTGARNREYRILQNGHRSLELPDGMVFRMIPEFCRNKLPGVGFRICDYYLSTRIPVPALTVDEQVYCHPPSFVVATVDKFARLPFEPRCSSLFGNVEFYHARFGYYRKYLISPSAGSPDHNGHPPGAARGQRLHVPVQSFDPPDIIIQDELHLIEGPLGSLAGIYETAIDFLSRNGNVGVKYIAATATVKRAEEQVKSLFIRRLLLFPPPGLTIDNRFFLKFRKAHPLDEEKPGRLYVGICAPGRGPHTPIIRIWSRLLQTAWNIAQTTGDSIDPFWTLVGYFNAVRELAGARNLYRQDIPERIRHISGNNPRQLFDDKTYELSSRTPSTNLPSILSILDRRYPDAPDALFTTSMFGTGVDVGRLSLMVVHGQPKTTSAYIQATGRVGREHGALVVTFYRATRPRDLSHYEFFCGYHQTLDKFMEDLTVAPFSQGTLDRAAGPVAVGILRNMRQSLISWYRDECAVEMGRSRNEPEVQVIPLEFEERSQKQPEGRKPISGEVRKYLEAKLDDWQQGARRNNNLIYAEYFTPRRPVVLGDLRHQHAGLPVIYRNTPQSLREIEETTGFET